MLYLLLFRILPRCVFFSSLSSIESLSLILRCKHSVIFDIPTRV
ncbi:hypothetical protein CLOSTMETH_03741 [[Clostridium] methylpentosum DSM 5476]|uniref:Uncharacterized protein n=1 Tax=[Clostridium] methylpentosum DSM 5476 TaxID=537013 RepID=C0EIP6_9FIRM|nr:hypothetical protein CLOSTMETH_03741 [[Clostridium] methylpentosum DSM 5476]